jgi:hypothetical protein
MSSINLDVDDYTNEELRELLDLPVGYTLHHVNTAKSNLETQLTHKPDMDAEQKRRIVFFLDSAVTRLNNRNIKPQQHIEPSSKAGTWLESRVPTQEYGSNILIDNPNTIAGRDAKITGGRAANSGDTPPGYLNPVNIRTTIQGINIDSRFRNDYYNTSASNFSVELPSIQRKVVSMRVAAIELPMTYHSISRQQGNNTFIIHCNFHGAQLEGSRFQNTGGNGSGFVSSDLSASIIPQYNYNFPWIPSQSYSDLSFSNVPVPYRGNGGGTPGGCIRTYPVSTAQVAAHFHSSNTSPGSFPVGSSTMLSVTGQNVGLPGDRIPAWKITIPDGNYEQRWMSESHTEYIERAVNNSIALAEPGYLDQESGFAQFHPVTDFSNVSGGEASARLRPNRDICFTVDHASGRGMFAAPTVGCDISDGLIGWTGSTFSADFTPTSGTGSKFENHGFALRWIVDSDGNLDIETSAQLRFGWQLGFRAGSYWCGGVPYNPTWRNTPGFSLNNNATGPYSQQTIGSAVSEAITIITGPRYGFLSINDHKTNTGATLVAAYANSTLDDNIISRIELASVMASAHAYQYSAGAGSSTELNRQREYFGPVDIQRLDMTLYDEYGRILELNNMDWSFTLTFEKLYS